MTVIPNFIAYKSYWGLLGLYYRRFVINWIQKWWWDGQNDGSSPVCDELFCERIEFSWWDQNPEFSYHDEMIQDTLSSSVRISVLFDVFNVRSYFFCLRRNVKWMSLIFFERKNAKILKCELTGSWYRVYIESLNQVYTRIRASKLEPLPSFTGEFKGENRVF